MSEYDGPVDYVAFDEPFVTTNGVDMGNPGTKGLLTLLSLLAEYEATELSSEVAMNIDFIDDEATSFWYNALSGKSSYEVLEDDTHQLLLRRAFETQKHYSMSNELVKAPSIFSTAGDDQVNIGTREKLLLVSECHRTNHMVISEDKDLVSPIAMIYCERLALRTKHNSFRNSVNDKDYEKHMMVDSLKMRLFSPMSKAQESSNEPNPAIGKSKVLTVLKEQLPADWKPWAVPVVNLRFQQRMYPYLPRTSNGAIDPIVGLPSQLGGLGLASKRQEVDLVVNSLSENHVHLANRLIRGDKDDRLKRALPSFTRDRFARGVNFDEGVVDTLFQDLAEHLEPPPMGVSRTLERFPDELIESSSLQGIFAKRRFLNRHGYVGTREIRSLYSRSVLQERLLTVDPTRGWSQSDWPERRAAYEATLGKLKAAKDLEGTFVGGELEDFSSRESLIERILCSNFEQMKSLCFEEDLFFHRNMNPIDYQSLEIDSGRRPVEEILDSMVRLELPPVETWFKL